MRTTIFIGLVAVLIVCSQTASAQGFVFPLKGVALDVMNANPFLKEGVGDMPPLRSKKVQRVGYMDEEWDEPIAGVSLDECSNMVHAHLGIGWDRRPLCVVIGIRGATHKYEEAYNNVRRYEAPLYPNTPRIQRVYSMNPGVKLPPDDPKRDTRPPQVIRQIAVLDESGHVTPTTTLIKSVGKDRQVVSEVGVGSGSGVVPTAGIGNLPATTPSENQQPSVLNCASLGSFLEKAKCFANAAAPK